ncbi:hypothetical protein MKW92_026094 [Papaver armeniacum]|nr:hypothetical protein MKW92_026094 [Papaver armeniacum]
MEECGKKRRTEEITIDKKLEEKSKTFVLAYPVYFKYRLFGDLVSGFEKSGFKITEMRCMNVSKEFAEKHLENIKQDPLDFDPNPSFMNWIDYIASAPVLAMIVEGDNSVFDKVFELTSSKEYPFWDGNVRRQTIYGSKSGEQAQRDIGLWFKKDTFKITESKKVVFILPTGDIHGPQEQVEAVLKSDECYELKQDFKDNFFMEALSVLLINPLAYQEGCVGDILNAIECSCLGIRGLTLVRRPTDDSGEIDGDEYGVAVVASAMKPCLRIKPGNAKMSKIDKNEYEIGSDYLEKIEQGRGPQGLLEATKKYFKYGFSVWGYPPDDWLYGCMFEASLVGLELLQ